MRACFLFAGVKDLSRGVHGADMHGVDANGGDELTQDKQQRRHRLKSGNCGQPSDGASCIHPGADGGCADVAEGQPGAWSLADFLPDHSC